MLAFRDLYRYYSRLEHSSPEGRPIEIARLEKRLVHSFCVRGGYGIVDDAGNPGLLRRSLLWCRGSDEPSLQRISFQLEGLGHWAGKAPPPPSWSWMAYQGGIDYLDLSFDPIEWAYRDIESPWSGAAMGAWDVIGDSAAGRTELKVVVRSIKPGGWKETHSQVIYDIPAEARKFGRGLKCVILGRQRSRGFVQTRTYCVLLVIPLGSHFGHRRNGELCYERVGAGYLCSDLIELEELGVLASIF